MIGLIEAAKLIGINKATLLKMCKNNSIEHVLEHKGGDRVRYFFSIKTINHVKDSVKRFHRHHIFHISKVKLSGKSYLPEFIEKEEN